MGEGPLGVTGDGPAELGTLPALGFEEFDGLEGFAGFEGSDGLNAIIKTVTSTVGG